VAGIGLQLRPGTLLHCLAVRPDCSEWEVEIEGEGARALAFPSLSGPLRPGDRVLLNTTAVSLGLGTGGCHFVVARLGPGDEPEGPFPGREAGHVMKLRYTPLQLRVPAAEEPASPHHEAVARFETLEGVPVVAAELLSQAAAAAVAARAAAPDLRIALLWLDTAALPLGMSRLVDRLRTDGVLHATITAGQAFGGDYEAVNVYSGLVVARAAARADLILVTQGPGTVGTGTRFGFSGISLVEALHAADTLGGTGILAARMSQADPRERHQGLSHHTRTILECLRARVTVPVPQECLFGTEATHSGHPVVMMDTASVMGALESCCELTSMGRSPEEDPVFWKAAVAAGLYAARVTVEKRVSNN
jgi:hypothetical protein